MEQSTVTVVVKTTNGLFILDPFRVDEGLLDDTQACFLLLVHAIVYFTE